MWFRAECPDCKRTFPVKYVAGKQPVGGVAKKRCSRCAAAARVCVDCGVSFTVTNHRTGGNMLQGNKCELCRSDPWDHARLRDKENCIHYEDCLWKCKGSRVCTDDCDRFIEAQPKRADDYVVYSSSLAGAESC